MIEEARIPDWVRVVARMTRRRARQGSERGYDEGRRSWRVQSPPPEVEAEAEQAQAEPVAPLAPPPGRPILVADEAVPVAARPPESAPGDPARGEAPSQYGPTDELTSVAPPTVEISTVVASAPESAPGDPAQGAAPSEHGPTDELTSVAPPPVEISTVVAPASELAPGDPARGEAPSEYGPTDEETSVAPPVEIAAVMAPPPESAPDDQAVEAPGAQPNEAAGDFATSIATAGDAITASRRLVEPAGAEAASEESPLLSAQPPVEVAEAEPVESAAADIASAADLPPDPAPAGYDSGALQSAFASSGLISLVDSDALDAFLISDAATADPAAASSILPVDPPAASLEPASPLASSDSPDPTVVPLSALMSAESRLPAPATLASPLGIGVAFAPPPYNRLGLDYRRPMPRPPVRGRVIDGRCSIRSAADASGWFEACDHFGIDFCLATTPLTEAEAVQRVWGRRLHVVMELAPGPDAPTQSEALIDEWRSRIAAFYSLGSRLALLDLTPEALAPVEMRLVSKSLAPVLEELRQRRIGLMVCIGNPKVGRGAPNFPALGEGSAREGRQEYDWDWETFLHTWRGTPIVAARLGGNPEDLPRLQRLLDRFPDLWLDCGDAVWMVREISPHREPAREFFVRNQDRILFASGSASGPDRGFEYLAGRLWCQRKLWETTYTGPSPLLDSDLPLDRQPTLHGLALPDATLEKIYSANAARFLELAGVDGNG